MLTVDLYSFSYKHGLPGIDAEHGGGFYFDCRCLPNPGRELAYKSKTGLDTVVIDYLEAIPAVDKFWNSTKDLVEQAVASYQQRNFSSLVVAYGCTGGQHRSVYCAERLKKFLDTLPDVTTTITHCQSGVWPRVG